MNDEPVFREARRELAGLTAGLEKRLLAWLAARMPAWVCPDHLTGLGLAAMLLGGAAYAGSGPPPVPALGREPGPRPELVRGQPGRHAGAPPGAAPPALRLLCGPRVGRLRRPLPRGRPRPLRPHGRRRGVGPARRLPRVLGEPVPDDPHPGE